jgi:hypothetical protein
MPLDEQSAAQACPPPATGREVPSQGYATHDTIVDALRSAKACRKPTRQSAISRIREKTGNDRGRVLGPPERLTEIPAATGYLHRSKTSDYIGRTSDAAGHRLPFIRSAT